MLTAAVLEGFVNSILRKNFDAPCDTPDFHREMWELFCSDHKQVAIAAPRGHAKSTAGTHAYGLAATLFRETDYVLVVSDTVSQAVQFLGDIKKELTDNEDLISLFGVKGLLKDTEDDIICEMDDGHLFRIQARGSEQKVRGLKWKNKRPSLLICDDMENDEIVLNRDRRLKFKRWFYAALLPAMSDRGKVRVVGTILHMDSLLENLMPGSQLASRPRGMDYLVREDLKEYATTKLPWKSIKYRAHTDDFSKLLWPQAKTVDYFKARKEDAVRQGLGDVYSQEMLNLPLDQSNTFFNRSDFIPMKVDDHKKSMIYYATCDLAVSTKERSDYSAFTIAGVDEDGKLYLKNVIRRRMDTLEIVETMFMLQKLYKPVLFGIEQGTIQKSIGPYLNDAMMKRGEFINIVLMKPTADKISRARSMQARMRSGAVKFDNEADWYAPFEDELLKFPRDKHDDQVDAWAYMGMLLDKMWEAPTNLEVEDEEYEAFLKTDNADSGRSVVTGY